jgi:hypothetical protein
MVTHENEWDQTVLDMKEIDEDSAATKLGLLYSGT